MPFLLHLGQRYPPRICNTSGTLICNIPDKVGVPCATSSPKLVPLQHFRHIASAAIPSQLVPHATSLQCRCSCNISAVCIQEHYRTSAAAAGFARCSQLSSTRPGQAVRSVRAGGMDRPSRPVVSLTSSQPGGPPCWASPLAFLLTEKGGEWGYWGGRQKRGWSSLFILVPWWKFWGRWRKWVSATFLIMSSFPLPYYPGGGCLLPRQFALGQDTAAY